MLSSAFIYVIIVNSNNISYSVLYISIIKYIKNGQNTEKKKIDHSGEACRSNNETASYVPGPGLSLNFLIDSSPNLDAFGINILPPVYFFLLEKRLHCNFGL
jgi:hypothetical protein